MYRLAFLLVLSVITFRAHAAEIVIDGKAPNLAGQTIRLSRVSDYITEKQELIGEVTVDAGGKFRFVYDAPSLVNLQLSIGNMIHLLYLEPGRTYVVEIPDAAGEQLFYPFETDTTQVFYQVGQFNYDFNYFMVQNYENFATGQLRASGKKFIEAMDLKYAFMNDAPYFAAYRDYKLAGLALSARITGMQNVYERYLANRPVLYEHGEYMYFFNEFYEGLMLQLYNSSKYPKIKSVIDAGTPYDTLLAAVQKHEQVGNAELAELFVIRGLYDMYYKAGIDRAKIENLLTEIKYATKKDAIRKIADNFIAVITRLKNGSPSVDFTGKRPDGTEVSLRDLLGKPVYLTFFSPDQPRSMQEIPSIKNLYDRMKKDVHFVSVCSGCTYSSLQQFQVANGAKWEFLLVDPSVESAYEVLAYPAAFLIDKNGTFFQSPGRLPSENAEFFISSLVASGKRNR